jgi:two-component system, NarL family, response regulator DevR
VTNHAEPADTASRSQDVPEAVTVLLLDDHPALLASLKEAVEADDTLTVVGTAGRIPDAIGLAVATQPRVAVIDVNMPDGGGWAAARALREVCPGIRLVAYSAFGEALVTRTIAAAGVSAFVSKDSDIEVLLTAIRGENLQPSASEPTPLTRRMTAAAPS